MLNVARRLENNVMTVRVFLVAGYSGGAGRSLTAALLAFGLHQDRPTILVRQTYIGQVSTIDAIETTLPLRCFDLPLPAPYVLPSDFTIGMTNMISGADTRFMTALHQMALSELGDGGNLVVDLCCDERALTASTLHDAFLILIPSRSSVFEVDWSVRTFARARDIQRYRDVAVPTLLATIVPESGRDGQIELLEIMMRACDPYREALPGDLSEVVVKVPYLDQAVLLALFDERPIWQDPVLIIQCREFAKAAIERADGYIDMLARNQDDL